MNHPVKTLAALALVGFLAPSAMAMSIKDDVVSLKLKGNVQARASLLNDASDSAGGDYDPMRGASGEAEAIRFDMRRVRLGFEAKLGDWSGNITLRSDKNDQAVGGGAGASAGRAIQLYYANIARTFKVDEMTHTFTLGLQKSFHAESAQSSSTFLFASDTIVSQLVEERGVGLDYMFTLPLLHFGVGLHNNSTGTKDTQASAVTNGEANGYFYSGRIEISPGADYMPAKRMESYYGQEGTHLVLGLDVQMDTGNLNDNADSTIPNPAAPAGSTPAQMANPNAGYKVTDAFTWGPDLLAHWNGLTAKAEYRMRTTGVDTTVGATGATTSATDVKAKFWDVQAGYAIPMDGYVIEPAIGYGVLDANDAVDSVASYGAGTDNGASGKTINLGVNLYWNGHDNKTQICFQNWKAESGSADANIIRIQQQLNF